ncbi:hypothetical protein Pla108_35230 [Botrimarina colliarenosi]|uniref:SprT-like family protein n=1 Tax=Botrimarina colliarenosi TaxID=2528001 RepID=A0A5C6A7S8_9BACT|nr:hypothetical protein [Botrimarina colliarenosi]TWT95375.1 hypothetical protein Pla108_35230 [Botrimarina colliarenosi]
MRVINHTGFDTADLRAIVRAVACHELEPAKRRVAVVEFRRSRRHLRGYAFINGRHSCIYLPPDADARPRWQLAALLAHEFAHNRGMRGERQMRCDSSRYGCGSAAEVRFAWAAELPLRKAVPAATKRKAKRGSDADRARLARVDELLREWERKEKLAKTKLARYRRERLQIERRLGSGREGGAR